MSNLILMNFIQAPDIPGIPPGNTDDGANYLAFLSVLKSLLPGKSVSIAAPSSYWYLRNYPIAEIAKVIDYIVFMTYDLHGQWDAGNANAQDGCPSGSCLRSDVNLTETVTALAMVRDTSSLNFGSYLHSYEIPLLPI